MLRVVCCYVEGMLRHETLDALQATGRSPDTDFVLAEIRRDEPRAYAERVGREWQSCLDRGDDLCLVEQDIEIGPTTLYDFRACQHLYCGNPYPWTTNVGIAMGCTRFRHQIIERYRDAVDEAIALGGGHFRQFDVIFQRRVLAKRHGAQPHVHAPVIHHNEAKRLRADASPVPLEGVPADDIGELL